MLDELSSALGIGADTPLTAGQTVSIFGEGQPQEYLARTFKPTTTTAGAEGALAASKPLTEQAYAQRGSELQGQVEPLKQRYQTLLDQITGQQNKDLTQQGQVLSNEYGKRGIPISSGIYQQDLANKDTNINQFYTGQSKDVTFEREQKLTDISNMLAELPIQKAQELNQIDQQIAQLKMTGANQQQQLALEMYKEKIANDWAQKEYDLKKQNFELQKFSAGAQSSIQAAANPNVSLESLFSQFGGGLFG